MYSTAYTTIVVTISVFIERVEGFSANLKAIISNRFVSQDVILKKYIHHTLVCQEMLKHECGSVTKKKNFMSNEMEWLYRHVASQQINYWQANSKVSH